MIKLKIIALAKNTGPIDLEKVFEPINTGKVLTLHNCLNKAALLYNAEACTRVAMNRYLHIIKYLNITGTDQIPAHCKSTQCYQELNLMWLLLENACLQSNFSNLFKQFFNYI